MPNGVDAATVLNVLATLSAPERQGDASLSSVAQWLTWIPVSVTGLFEQLPEMRSAPTSRAGIDAVRAMAQVRGAELRVGGPFVAGTRVVDGKTQRVFLPLVEMVVQVPRAVDALFGPSLRRADAPQATPLITDLVRRARFEGQIVEATRLFRGNESTALSDFVLASATKLRSLAISMASSAGFEATEMVAADHDPKHYLGHEGLLIIAGFGIYPIAPPPPKSRRWSLLEWAESRVGPATAFHHLYALAPPEPPSPIDAADEVQSPFRLNARQASAVAASRHQPLLAIGGPPGTGKTQTIAAIALDAVDRGESVLIAVKSDAALDAAVDTLERVPGPTPVVFGGGHTERVATALLARLASSTQTVAIEAARGRHRELHEQTIALEREITALLVASSDAVDGGGGAPAALLSAAELARLGELVGQLEKPGRGWRNRRARRRAIRSLERLLPGVSSDAAGEFLRHEQNRRRLIETDRPTVVPDEMWSRLLQLREERRRALTSSIELVSRSVELVDGAARTVVTALCTALRSGQAARHRHLQRIADDKLTEPLPIWMGTLDEIEDLLPPVPRLFDLVILDEASSIDQPTAAPALLRGTRGVIVGDPKQLRHVSFRSDDSIAEVLATHHIDGPLAVALDVRRNSAFDVAAGAGPLVELDEHYRCKPHLIDFVARELYEERVRIATRNPSTDLLDCIETKQCAGGRDADGVAQAEINVAIDKINELHGFGARSIGIITPFRAQADAIERAALERFTPAFIDEIDLRIGTVHAFQGNERDFVIASLAVDSEGANAWRFVEDPNLLCVMLTRARVRLYVLYSSAPPADSLLGRYLAQADAPPGPLPAAAVSTWCTDLALDLARTGIKSTPGYRTGRHVVDICVDTPRHHYAIETDVHRDGPQAHIERHVELVERGWRVLEAFPAVWNDRRGELVIELANRLRAD